jgi:hypothetical protein
MFISAKKERSPMLALAIKLVLVLAVMLGGAGVTAVAAQNSLPNEALYPVKLFMEEVQWGSAVNAEAQIDVQLDHAQQRVREMAQLTDRGTVIPSEVPVRLQTQLQAALQVAAQLDDQALSAALDHIQLRLRDQLREMEQLHLGEAVQALTQAQALAQLGQQDPQAFRARCGHGRPADAPPQSVMTPRADPSRTPPGPHATMTPQPSRTPQATRTPQNHSYGPGPQGTAQPAPTPVGQGDGHEYGPGPQATTAPGGGEPQGNQDGLGGNGGCDNCGNDNSGGDNGGGDSSGGDTGGGGDNGGSGGNGGH